MSEKDDQAQRDRSLNPALKRELDEIYDTKHSSRAPADSASVQREEGTAWPWIWLVVAVLSALITLYILFW